MCFVGMPWVLDVSFWLLLLKYIFWALCRNMLFKVSLEASRIHGSMPCVAGVYVFFQTLGIQVPSQKVLGLSKPT